VLANGDCVKPIGAKRFTAHAKRKNERLIVCFSPASFRQCQLITMPGRIAYNYYASDLGRLTQPSMIASYGNAGTPANFGRIGYCQAGMSHQEGNRGEAVSPSYWRQQSLRVHDECLSSFTLMFPVTKQLHLFVRGVEFRRLLACVHKTSFFFLLPSFRNINVVVRRELLGLLTAHHFKIDESGLARNGVVAE
jgi:hypothetical protein